MALPVRERIGDAIAYDLDWSKVMPKNKGRHSIFHCGGTVWVEQDGKTYKITVTEESSE